MNLANGSLRVLVWTIDAVIRVVIGSLLVLRAEALRLLRLRSTYATLLLLAALSGLRTFVAVGWTAEERGGDVDPLSSGGAWAPFVDGWALGLVFGTLVLLVHAARTIAGDRESGVLRLAATRSTPRCGLVLGRALLAPLLVAAVVAVTGLTAWLVAGSLADFGPFVEDGYEILKAAELREEVSRSVRAVLPPLLATYAFGLFISCLARGATLSSAAALGLFLAFDLFKTTLGDAHYWVFASHVPTPADGSTWSELPGVARGFSDSGFPAELIQAGFDAAWPALIVFTLGACVVLQRRSL